MSTDAVLCYIDPRGSGPRIATFTTRGLDKQWGDDWNDAPYEHNAGSPYDFAKHNAERGDEPWSLIDVVFDAPELEDPASHQFNSRWSVEMINKRETPWLVGKGVAIWAGVTIAEFKRLVREAGGKIYTEER